MGTSLHQASRESLLCGCLTSAFFGFISVEWATVHTSQGVRRGSVLESLSLLPWAVATEFHMLQHLLPCTQLLLAGSHRPFQPVSTCIIPLQSLYGGFQSFSKLQACTWLTLRLWSWPAVMLLFCLQMLHTSCLHRLLL